MGKHAACSEYQKKMLLAAKLQPIKVKANKKVARGIETIQLLLEPGQQRLTNVLEAAWAKQMQDTKDQCQRFMISFFPTIA